MPKLKPSMQEERNRIVRACIAGNKERLAIDDAALAVKVGVTKKTIQNKYHRPETYSLDEMQKIATVLKFTPAPGSVRAPGPGAYIKRNQGIYPAVKGSGKDA